MKKPIFLVVMTLTIIFTGLFLKTSAQSSTDVLNKAIAFHDSLHIWNDYSGKVNLMTVFTNRNSGGEAIEINTKEGYYNDIVHATKTIRGIKDGECFLEVNGNKRTPNENQVQTIQLYKNWHYFHFGILMELEASGLVLGDKVQSVKFQGRDCFAITFTFDADKIKNDYLKDSNWTVYIDPVNYSMRGYKEDGLMNCYAVFSGILKVNGLKLPLCRVYFNNEDDSFYMVDLFTSAD